MSQKKIPLFALVGRPNVGKSSLFNRILKKDKVIVDAKSGTTRDRIYGTIEHNECLFSLIDTAGLCDSRNLSLEKDMIEHTQKALEDCQHILFVVDSNVGIHPLDQDIAEMLRHRQKNTSVLVNKVDSTQKNTESTSDFFSLGFESVFPVSAKHNLGIDELKTALFDSQDSKKRANDDNPIKISFLGRPNVGKSSLLNALLKEERLLVSEQAGTTRDSVDILIKRNKEQFIFIDTAGLRYRRKVRTNLESHSTKKSIENLRNCDIACVLLNAEEGLTTQDLKIINLVKKERKPSLILVNKWDLFHNMHQRDFMREELEKFKPFPHLSVLFLSAKTGQNVFHIFDAIKSIQQEKDKRISTGILNRFLKKIIQKNPPSYKRSKCLKVYYLSQVDTNPPVFLFSINSKSLLDTAYERYLKNQIYTHFGFEGYPITLKFKDQ